MNFEKPELLWTMIFSLIPLIHMARELSQVKKTKNFIFKTKQLAKLKEKEYKVRILIKNIFLALCCICLAFALANPYWGTKVVPVQKNGNSLTMVFDVSWSMMADDCEEGKTRLSQAKAYARDLILEKSEGIDIASVAVVATKGNAVTLVPQTEDHNEALTLIEALNPGMFTTVGSNIAKGIEEAVLSFPANQARQNTIVVFTDAGETDGSIEKAIIQAASHGINVFIVGFGSQEGTDIFIGNDFVTNFRIFNEENQEESEIEQLQNLEKQKIANKNPVTVHTKLESDKIETMIADLKSKTSFPKIKIEYLDGKSEIEKAKLISFIYRNADDNSEKSQLIGYETKNVSHHTLFIVLAFSFALLGVFFGYFTVPLVKSSALIVFLLLLNSCSATIEQESYLLQGSFFWHQGNYQKAEIKFLETLSQANDSNNKLLEQYAILGLGSSYAMQNEEIAAYSRLTSISEDSPDAIKFSSNYNMGVLAFSQGDYKLATEYFKKALTIDSNSVDAKINYELSLKQEQKDNQGSENKGKSASAAQRTVLKDTLFSIIRENDQNIWKNHQKEQSPQNSLDY
ncbi:MAG: VWA domain-containing protein [Treponemataceae bacterium]|nr:VWA domain-containing protein [Treponemataceae bacterium]